ncbi:acyl-CoA dehydrogenase family protein [Ramlibacter sp. AN1133]|uniref:acyl-CoA dehydrogenase family protein n=1 Tax=Ramlibacter sp. AN1133 TaxID=3133429 RepID=UPI0030C17612
MNFELDEGQRALQDSVARLLADHHGLERYRAAAASEAGYSAGIDAQMVQMGLPAMLVPEAYGGIGGNATDLMAVMREGGRSLLASPLLPCSVLPAVVLAQARSMALRDRWLTALATGEVRIAWAHEEPGSDLEGRWLATRARREGEGWRLAGLKPNVLFGAIAGHFLVSARVAAEDGEAAGLALFLVAADAPGVACRPHRLVDDTPAATVSFHDAPATIVTDVSGDAGLAALHSALAVGIAALCADMVGAMEAAVKLTIEYLNVRKQFGQVLAANQALRHRVAEMHVGVEMAASMAIAAAVAAGRPEDPEARCDLHRAKLLVGRNARDVCHAAIQLHGGIGMTQEYAVGHYLRRVHVLDQLFGQAGTHAADLDALLSAGDPNPATFHSRGDRP